MPELSLHDVLDTMADGLFTIDTDCRIQLWNGAMERLTGYSAEDVRGRPCDFLRCDASPREGAAAAPECEMMARDSDETVRGECAVRGHNGETIPVMKSVRVLRDANGEAAGLVATLTDLRTLKRLETEVSAWRTSMSERSRIGRLVGASRAMREVFEKIALAADSEATVLITGETGTGKELAAEAAHTESERRGGPFIRVNCSALPETLLESELFGHVRGAFTGAVKEKVGRFEAADGGTIFLDEIGDISPLIQLKLLRVLQERRYERVGESVTRETDVRVVAATHRDLRRLVAEGTFRQDLFYRINVFPIHIAPLRERREDIALLVEKSMERFREQTGKPIDRLSVDAHHAIMDYCWPGNVRELENAIEHAFVTCQGREIDLFDLPVEIRRMELRASECGAASPASHSSAPSSSPIDRGDTPDDLRRVLEASGWNRSEAARRLGVDRTTIWRRMQRWSIEPPQQ